MSIPSFSGKLASVRIGDVAVNKPYDLEGTDCLMTSSGNKMHVVYALEKIVDSDTKQLSLLRQSIHTAFSIGCAADECKKRLIVHVFYEGFRTEEMERYISRSVLDGLDLILHPTHFDEHVSTKRKVWGYNGEKSIIRKLSTSANYFRYYCASILRQQYSAESFLYVDTDTVFVTAGLGALFQRPLPLASFGVQNQHTCTADKMLLLHDERLKHYKINKHDPCLASGVMLVNISLWVAENITSKLEEALVMNAQHKLWHLGSLPPLMVVLHGKWISLAHKVMDGKGSNCETIQASRHLIVHPFKAECSKFRSQPRICSSFTCHSQIEVGSHRIACQQSKSLAQILNAPLIGLSDNHKTNECDIIFRYADSPVHLGNQSHIPTVIHFKARSCETCRSEFHEFKIADNDFIDQMLKVNKMKSIRLNLVEDVRPPFIRHTVYTGLFGASRPAVLCYHGNSMHLHSLVRSLLGIRFPYVLRFIVPRRQRHDLLKLINEQPVCNSAKRASSDLTTMLRGSGNPSAEIIVSNQKCEIIEYNTTTIYEQLSRCDIGLAPMTVSQKLSIPAMADVTSEYFEPKDVQPEDFVLRCKRTSNAGRAFLFLQVGVPTIADPCPDVLKFAATNKDGDIQQIITIAHRREAWSNLINSLLNSAEYRRRLSQKALEFSNKELTVRHQAGLLLNKLSCLKRNGEQLYPLSAMYYPLSAM
jgi:hypothetical protein